jgi:putative transposase
MPVKMVCNAFDISRSSYYEYRQRRKHVDVERPDIPNHLAREFTVDRPNQAWCGDITYVWSGQRWSYLAVVLDLYARRVVGWAMSSSPDADLVVKALAHASEQRGQPE